MAKTLQEMRDSVARNLSAAMADKDVTQKELAAQFNVGQATVSNWCTGMKKPRTEMLTALAEWFQIPMSFFIETGVFENWPAINADRRSILKKIEEQWGEEEFHDVAYVIYGIEIDNPYHVQLRDFTAFFYDHFSSVDYVDGSWHITPRTPTPVTEDRRSQIQILFDQLTPANQTKLLELCDFYLSQQRKNEET
jgi:transcriptional regulator with XRE-family HTH domain